MCPYIPYHNNRTIDKFDDSLAKPIGLADKLYDDTTELE
jgi:hypothetical protein